MADQQELQIVIEAINKASAQLKQVEKDLGGLNSAIKTQGSSANTAAMSFGALVGGVTLGATAAIIAAQAFSKLLEIVAELPGAFFNFIKAASEVEGLAIAMYTIANNAGITAKEINKVRDSVVAQNITTEAANRLIADLIRNQIDYTKATELATAAQDIAVVSNRDSSETLELMSHAISANNTMVLRQLGLTTTLDNVYENYGATIGKTSETMTEMERKLAIMNYILEEGKKYTGAYAASMENAAKIMRSLERAQREIAYVFGSIFNDALAVVSKRIYTFVDDISKWADANKVALKNIGDDIEAYVVKVVNSFTVFFERNRDVMYSAVNFIIGAFQKFVAFSSVVFNVLQVLAGGFEFMARSAIQAGKVIYNALKGNWEGVAKAGQEWIKDTEQIVDEFKGNMGDIVSASILNQNAMTFDLKKWWDNISTIDKGGWDDKLKKAEEEGNKLTAKQRKKLEDMTKAIIKENKEYAKQVAKRAKDFSESLDDLVMSHRDKIKSLTDDLSKENSEYNKNLLEFLADYDKAMADIKKSHKKKTESVMKDMEDERKKTEEEIKEITKKYNEERTLIEKEGEARLGNLQVQLDRELTLGDNANKEKIEALKKMIAYEQEGLSTSLDDKKDIYDEEVSDINKALNEKLEEIKKGLEEENQAYEEALTDRKNQYDKDVLDAKTSYEEKRQALQTELDTEISIRNKYADDFKRIGDRIAADDITRLISKYNEEKAEAEYQHQEKLADIKEKGFEQGLALGNSISQGIENSGVKQNIKNITGDFDRMINKVDTFNSKAGKLGDFYPPSSGGRYSGFAAQGGLFSKPTVVGEAGAEVVLPLNFPKRMAQIMESMGMSGGRGGSVVQNFYVSVSSKQDVDVLMERAGFAYKQGGGYL